jgi:hypothetical protein
MWYLLANSYVLKANKVFRNAFSGSIFLLQHVFIFFRNQYSLFLILSSRWEFPKIFSLYNINDSFQFLMFQSISENSSEIVLDFSRASSRFSMSVI